VNTALKKYTRTRYTKELYGEDVAEKDYLQNEDPTAFEHLNEKDILTLIHALPEGYRIEFRLYVMEGYRHEEIAEMLGINAGTSRSQLSKARQMLQKQLLELHQVAI
jgi:RNA polymerase sigma-70 factor (ECF subfamily)